MTRNYVIAICDIGAKVKATFPRAFLRISKTKFSVFISYDRKLEACTANTRLLLPPSHPYFNHLRIMSFLLLSPNQH